MSKKIVPVFPKVEYVEFEFGERTIEVKTIISVADQEFFATQYLDSFFKDGGGSFGMKTDFLEAELVLDISILFSMTNLKMDSTNIEMDDVYASGLMDRIRGLIGNLPYVKKRINRLVELKLQEENSIGSIVEKAVSALSGLEPEKIQEMAESVKELEEQVKDSPLSDLMEEGKK